MPQDNVLHSEMLIWLPPASQQALNKGETPPIIADRIEVTELNMGTIVRRTSVNTAHSTDLTLSTAAGAGNSRDW